MAITPSTTLIIPPVDQKSADKYWITNLTINAQRITEPVNVRVSLMPYNSTTGEQFPSMTKIMFIEDLFTIAETNQDVANVITNLFDVIDALAKERNII